MERTLETARKYDGLNENKDKMALQRILGIDPSVTPWCSHFVKAVLLQAGYDVSAAGGKASSWSTWGEPCDPEPGCLVVFNAHVAFLCEDLESIYGGNQSDGVNAQPMKYYGEPIAYRRAKQVTPENVFGKVEPEMSARKKEQLESVGAEIEEAVAETKAELTSAAQAIDQHFKSIDEKLAMIDKRLANIESYLAQFSAEIDEV